MTLNIWRFTDGKPGHDSQSIGLCAAIERLKPCQRFDIPVDTFFNSCNHFLFKRFPSGKDLPDPSIMIGAGHGTHLPMLAARRVRNGRIIVLMTPSLPLSFFDLCIIPKHDRPPDRDNIIATTGALNPIQFNHDKILDQGLILLGGPSSHYQWNNPSILKQIKEIITVHNDIQWVIADSPRTPKDTLTAIRGLADENITLLHYENTDTNNIHKQIFTSNYIWVSTDSISMIYESLSSGASVGLLEVAQKQDNRVSNGINALIKQNQLTTFSAWQEKSRLAPNDIKLNEAQRCVLLLSERGILD